MTTTAGLQSHTSFTGTRWLAKDPANVVHLQCASFGYEHIFMAIHKKFKTKVKKLHQLA